MIVPSETIKTMDAIAKNSSSFGSEVSFRTDQETSVMSGIEKKSHVEPVSFFGVEISEANSDPVATTVQGRVEAISQDQHTPLICSSSELNQHDDGETSSQSTSRSSSISGVESLVVKKTFTTVGTQTDDLGKQLTGRQDPNQNDQVEAGRTVAAGDGVSNTSIKKISSVSEKPAEEKIGPMILSTEEKKLYRDYTTQISDPNKASSAGVTFNKLLHSLAIRSQADLEGNFEKELAKGTNEELRKIHDFLTLHHDNYVVSFDSELSKKYKSTHDGLKKAFIEYLVCREIVHEKLKEGLSSPQFDKELDFLVDLLGQKKETIQETIGFLDSMEQEITQENERRERESYAKEYPALSLEEARERWLQDDSNKIK